MTPEAAQLLDNYMRGPVPREVGHAYLDLANERDQLRADLERERGVKRINDQAFNEALTERDALREIVEALRSYLRMVEAADADVDQQERLALHLHLLRRIRRLDGEEEET